MLSNKELRAKAVELAKKLTIDLPSDLEQMKSDDLGRLVADLERTVAAAMPTPGESKDGVPPAGSDAPAESLTPTAAASGARYFIPLGKSLAGGRRGVLGPGAEVFPTDIGGLNNDGKKSPAQVLEAQNKQLDYLASRGHLNKR